MNQRIKTQRAIRKAHRYLGAILGVQFLAWTLGGLYFSWANIAQIRGEDIRAEKKNLPIAASNKPLTLLLDSLQKKQTSIKSLQVVDILGKAFYQIQTEKPAKKALLFDMQTLALKPPLTAQEARNIARNSLKTPSEAIKTDYITNTNGHHEYREKPLPAYAVTFGAPYHTTVYVAAELGTVQSYRNNAWRTFDFLWMLHTMDYENRDNINNWALRIFSLFGLITILSGFVLFFITARMPSLPKQNS